MKSLVVIFLLIVASATQEDSARKTLKPLTDDTCLASSPSSGEKGTMSELVNKIHENEKKVQELLAKIDALEKKVLPDPSNPESYQATSMTEMMSELIKKVEALEKKVLPSTEMTSELIKKVEAELIKKVEALEKKLPHPFTVGKDCAELYNQGHKQDGVYTINPDGLGEFQVYCDQTTSGGGWIIFQRRLDGSVDFYRAWDEYQNGFGDVRGEYWLGLDKINRLTRLGSYRLRVDLQDTSSNWRYAEYENFSVLSEQTKYKLSIGKYTGTAGDSLSWHNNHPFSTKDRDNDSFGGNCAEKHKGAWWYNHCHNSNLNGLYHYGTHNSYADGVNWVTWKDHNFSYKRAEMKVRPMSS